MSEELRAVIREEVRRVLREELRRELRKIFLELLPYVSDEEQEEIEREFSPDEQEEFVRVEW